MTNCLSFSQESIIFSSPLIIYHVFSYGTNYAILCRRRIFDITRRVESSGKLWTNFGQLLKQIRESATCTISHVHDKRPTWKPHLFM